MLTGTFYVTDGYWTRPAAQLCPSSEIERAAEELGTRPTLSLTVWPQIHCSDSKRKISLP
jgi:hypothetical protein